MRTLTQIARDLVAQGVTENQETSIRHYVYKHLPEVLVSYMTNPNASIDLAQAVANLEGDDLKSCAMAFLYFAQRKDLAIDNTVQMIRYRIECLSNPEDGFPCPEE